MNKYISATAALLKQRQLLQIEYNTEKEAYRCQTQSMGISRKVKRGDAWFPLQVGRSYYNSLNQPVIEVTRTADQEISHNFEYGKPVVFFYITDDAKQQIAYLKFTAQVSYVEGDKMVIVLPDGLHAVDLQQSGKTLGVQLFFDETSYRLMFNALDKVINAKGNRLAYLRDLFYSNTPAKQFTFDPVSFPWLNPSQEKAVNEVLRAKDVAVVHGPPGTGKTTTLVEAINEVLMRESQVLVCAQSNMAVDWISEKLVDRGINVLRIGNPTRVNDKMLAFTYERRFADHPDYPELWAVRKTIRQIRQHRAANTHQKIERLKSRETELCLRINADVFGQARVIACTLTGSASRLLEGQKFTTLFIDEAAQALEAACWIPMKRVTRVVFAGDHCQLPATIKSMEALRGGLGKTLMERIVENKPEVVTLLTVQYRMNEQIMRFSGHWFYHDQVTTAPQIKFRGVLDYDVPIEWINTHGEVTEPDGNDTAADGYGESYVGENFGRVNRHEAALTLDVLQAYLTKVGKQRILDEHIDVGIISPYRAQVQYLSKLIRQKEFFKPFRRFITVNTVDGFQGQERDIIIVSMVRSNANGEIGFLRDLRRMNVAITRARMKLIIMGDAETLTHNDFYRQLWLYTQQLQQTIID